MDTTTSFGDPATSPSATISNAPNAVQRGVESAGTALHQGIDKIAEPARNAVDGLSSSAHQTVDSLAGSAGHVADRFADETRRISEAPAKALDYSKTRIQDRPLEAVGIALAVGFIFGRLTSR
jgi:ElaB/YqjD/DUF883 family membrane-anchored ribosome-binding protein